MLSSKFLVSKKHTIIKISRNNIKKRTIKYFKVSYDKAINIQIMLKKN